MVLELLLPPVPGLSPSSRNYNLRHQRNEISSLRISNFSQGLKSHAWTTTADLSRVQSLGYKPVAPCPPPSLSNLQSLDLIDPVSDMTTYRHHHDELKSDLSSLLNEDYGNYRNRPIEKVPSLFEAENVRPIDPTLDASMNNVQTPTVSASPLLAVPSTIKAPQSNMFDLAAEITCLLWFTDGATLNSIEQSPSSTLTRLSVSGVNMQVMPSIGFRKWATELIRTTAVAPNVILLALLFIHRLKKNNPTVKGDPGSEFRLLTVALMLGNKFLDDNTYTNKTWAEVSGLKIKEIHLMEVEFLSNMRYGLYTSQEDWSKWHQRLGKFGWVIHQIIRGGVRLYPTETKTIPIVPDVRVNSIPTSTFQPWDSSGFPPPLSFPGSNTVVPLRPPSLAFSNSTSDLLEPYQATSALKRLREHEDPSKPPKRHASMLELSRQAEANSQNALPLVATPTSRFHLPNLNVTAPVTAHGSLNSLMGTAPHLRSELPAPNTRAMSLVYAQPHLHRPQAPMIPPIQTSIPTPGLLNVDQANQLSPFGISSTTSSPTSATAYGNQFSPSFFLAQRSSPYRPVRRVQTLLVPPPIQSIQNAPTMVGANQMQYHILGHPNERHVGHVPYINYDAWPQTNQPSVWPVSRV